MTRQQQLLDEIKRKLKEKQSQPQTVKLQLAQSENESKVTDILDAHHKAMEKAMAEHAMTNEKIMSDGMKQQTEALSDSLTEISNAIRLIDLPAPQVTVKSPDQISVREPSWLSKLSISSFIAPIQDKLREIIEAIKEYKLPMTAEKPLSVRLSNGEKFYDAVTQIFGSGGGNIVSIPKVSVQGREYVSTTQGLTLPRYDYVTMTINSATETYTFKEGGSAGNPVATVVIVYTDATRTDISTVTKT